jgi:signal transduction histidine kinase
MDPTAPNRQACVVSSQALLRDPSLSRDDRLALGVVSAVASALRLDVLTLRLALVGLAISAPFAAPVAALAYLCGVPGTRALRRVGPRKRFSGVDARSGVGITGVLLLEFSLLLFLRRAGLTLPDKVAALVVAIQLLIGFSWRRLEVAERWSWLTRVGEGRDIRVGGRRLSVGILRLAAGLGLFVAAAYLLTKRPVRWQTVRASVDLLWPVSMMVLGTGLVFLPPLLRVGSQFSNERRERIRADERARLATHLHDSVLQTLTLIQRHGDDPANMATLARKQERELRDWLYGAVASADAGRLRDRLTALAAEVEDRYRWRVELIVVGDADVGKPEEALLAATREAMVNAARHSGAPSCDVYAECRPDGIQVFVRDRGQGFDENAVPGDRRGLADSIVARMGRVSGTARVRSAPETGTEVLVELPRLSGEL